MGAVLHFLKFRPLSLSLSLAPSRWVLSIAVQGVFALCLFCAFAAFSHAQTASKVRIKNAWARATVSGQSVSGAFMTLTAPQDLTLRSISSPATTATEIHTTLMDNGIMRMRALPNGLQLPAGKAVALQPGQRHIMLLGLKQTLKTGDTLPLTLLFEDNNGNTSSINTTIPIAHIAPKAED